MFGSSGTFGAGSETNQVLYAEAGEVGTITEVFHNLPPVGGQKTKKMRRWYGKVRIDGKTKTFRLTSLERIQ